MEIMYKSTRGHNEKITASAAILKGLSSDGGLFVPEYIPKLTEDLEELKRLSYKEIAQLVMSKFLGDFTEEELKYCIDNAYDDKFDIPSMVNLHKCGDCHYLELFHGKTIAFKDMALSILPYLMTTSAKKNNLEDKIIILTATSGDTGKAAMAGFADVPGTGIIVFYPKDGVSPVQERQMITQRGDNTCVIAIKGNFDNAQTGVKAMFNNEALARDLKKKGYVLSSANSINIGRLVPQVVYYVYSYLQLLEKGEIQRGREINFVVPTGNFGDILAGYYAKQMGIPINKLICASNENRVLYDFFTTGTYDRKRKFHLTMSPSMDILVSSNLERLLYAISGENAEEIAEFMEKLSRDGEYTISHKEKDNLRDFYGNFATEEECGKIINEIYRGEGYVIDPHTAVAAAVYEKYKAETGDNTKTVIVSTASPYKFPKSVLSSINPQYSTEDIFRQIRDLNEISRVKIPKAILEIEDAPIRHNTVVDKDDMEKAVRNRLGV